MVGNTHAGAEPRRRGEKGFRSRHCPGRPQRDPPSTMPASPLPAWAWPARYASGKAPRKGSGLRAPARCAGHRRHGHGAPPPPGCANIIVSEGSRPAAACAAFCVDIGEPQAWPALPGLMRGAVAGMCGLRHADHRARFKSPQCRHAAHHGA